MSEAKIPHVLMLIDRYWPDTGGSATVARTICEQGLSPRCRFSILTRYYQGDLPRVQKINGIPVIRYGKSRFRRISKILFVLSAMAYMIWNRKKYDLVHVHLCEYETDLLPVYFACLVARKPYVIHLHGMLTVEWMLKETDKNPLLRRFRQPALPQWLSRAALRSAQAIIAIEKETIESLNQHGFQRNCYIPNGIQVPSKPVSKKEKSALRQLLHLPQRATVVIYVGNLHWYKNVICILKAWLLIPQRIQDEHLKLLIVGGLSGHSDSNEDELKAFVEKHRMASVTFKGAVSNVLDYLNASDVFVFPSCFEGMPLSVIEAMSCGLPVIVSDISGNRDLVPSEEYGLIFDPSDHKALAEKLVRVLRDKEMGRALGRRVRRRVEEQFSSDLMVRRITALYDGIFTMTNPGSKHFRSSWN